MFNNSSSSYKRTMNLEATNYPIAIIKRPWMIISLASVIITVITIDRPRGVDEMLETLRISKVRNLMEPRAPVR